MSFEVGLVVRSVKTITKCAFDRTIISFLVLALKFQRDGQGKGWEDLLEQVSLRERFPASRTN